MPSVEKVRIAPRTYSLPVAAIQMPPAVPTIRASRKAMPPRRMVAGASCNISSLTVTPDFL